MRSVGWKSSCDHVTYSWLKRNDKKSKGWRRDPHVGDAERRTYREWQVIFRSKALTIPTLRRTLVFSYLVSSSLLRVSQSCSPLSPSISFMPRRQSLISFNRIQPLQKRAYRYLIRSPEHQTRFCTISVHQLPFFFFILNRNLYRLFVSVQLDLFLPTSFFGCSIWKELRDENRLSAVQWIHTFYDCQCRKRGYVTPISKFLSVQLAFIHEHLSVNTQIVVCAFLIIPYKSHVPLSRTRSTQTHNDNWQVGLNHYEQPWFTASNRKLSSIILKSKYTMWRSYVSDWVTLGTGLANHQVWVTIFEI